MTKNAKPHLGRFELRAEIGRGFHGRVYLAWDPQLERKVAIKLLLRATGDKANQAQFLGEARAAGRLAHPNVIPIYESGFQGQAPYLVFEYVEGEALKMMMRRRGALPEAEALEIFRQVLDGMAAAHAQGVAHLDLSPGNLMLDKQGRVRVMDFGLARLSDRPTTHQQAEEVYGSPRYMSPEHFQGGKLDAQTDVFALGLILFELLGGRPAVKAKDLATVSESITQGRMDWAALSELDVSPEIIGLVRDALATDRKTRYRDACEMQGLLAEILSARARPSDGDVAVQFLLRRLQRRPEFPAFSNSIVEINRLTAEDSTAGVRDLAAVVQRDFSLTNRLMKVANSAFFGRSGDGVTTVSQAINMVGIRLVRMLCNGLVVFDHLQQGRASLQDALVSSFVAGLMARHLGGRVRRELAEEAFVGALFNRLGRNLVMYYLEDEYTEIEVLVSGGVARPQAEKRVLATSCAAIGKAIATTWKFPPVLLECMTPLLSGMREAPATTASALHAYAHLSNELSELANAGPQDALPALDALVLRYAGVFNGTPAHLGELLGAALEKFRELAPTLGVETSKNGFCLRATAFLESLKAEEAAATEEQNEVAAA